jgi:selenocysteine lyase/cysteine desulfurase
MDSVRSQAAKFLGCELGELGLVPSTTMALNIVASGLVDSGFLADGHRILTSDQEHPGGEACWRHYEGLGLLGGIDRVVVSPSPSSAAEIVDAFAAAMTAQTRAICVSHVLTTSGVVMPLRELGALAHAHGALLIVDGAQAAGSIEVELEQLGADVYTVSAHKWMLAPPGSALLYLCVPRRRS